MTAANCPAPGCGFTFTKAEVYDYVDNGNVPEPFLDIMTQDVMRKPVQVAQTGQVYDRQSLAQWRKQCLDKGIAISDPNTNVAIGRNAKLQRVPQLEQALNAFRYAVNRELATRGEQPLEEPAKASLWGACLGCFGG